MIGSHEKYDHRCFSSSFMGIPLRERGERITGFIILATVEQNLSVEFTRKRWAPYVNLEIAPSSANGPWNDAYTIIILL